MSHELIPDYLVSKCILYYHEAHITPQYVVSMFITTSLSLDIIRIWRMVLRRRHMVLMSTPYLTANWAKVCLPSIYSVFSRSLSMRFPPTNCLPQLRHLYNCLWPFFPFFFTVLDPQWTQIFIHFVLNATKSIIINWLWSIAAYFLHIRPELTL